MNCSNLHLTESSTKCSILVHFSKTFSTPQFLFQIQRSMFSTFKLGHRFASLSKRLSWMLQMQIGLLLTWKTRIRENVKLEIIPCDIWWGRASRERMGGCQRRVWTSVCHCTTHPGFASCDNFSTVLRVCNTRTNNIFITTISRKFKPLW